MACRIAPNGPLGVLRGVRKKIGTSGKERLVGPYAASVGIQKHPTWLAASQWLARWRDTWTGATSRE